MHPGFFGWWQGHHNGRGGGCETEASGEGDCNGRWAGGRGFRGGPFGHGPGHGHPGHGHGPGHGGGHDFDGDGGGFGVRRPLRFLAWKLELEEPQVAKLAAILDELKIERAQAAVDQRRSIGSFADAVRRRDVRRSEGQRGWRHAREERREATRRRRRGARKAARAPRSGATREALLPAPDGHAPDLSVSWSWSR